MATNDDDEERRSAALLNAPTVLLEGRRAEEALRKQSEWLRVTLASIGDAVISTDADGRITFMNAVAESLTGWANDDAAGQPLDAVFRVVHEQTRQTALNPATKALREGVITGLANHSVLIAKDGAERSIDDSAAPIRGQTGEIVGCVLTFRDITERRRAERVLRENEARKTAMFEAALDAIVSIDHAGTIIEFNAAAERIFGHRREDVLGRELAAVIIPPAFRERHRRGLSHYLATGEGPVLNKRLELSALRADGAEFPIELTVTRLPVDGTPLFSAYVRDITERKQAETALRESEERFRAAVGAVSSLIWTNNAQGQMEGEQLGWGNFTGQTYDEYQGYGWSQAVHPEDAQPTIDAWTQAVAEARTFVFEHRVRRRDGEWRLCSIRAVPVLSAEGQIREWVGVHTDITEQRRAEQQLRDLAADLSEADRHKDEFLATLAHELRNPLAPVRSSLEVLQQADGDPVLIEQVRSTMVRQIGQMVRLIDDLLDVSRITRDKLELRKERVELASIVHEAVEACRPAVEQARHELTVSLPPRPVHLHADPVRLAQVINNLLHNACKYSEPGGRISLTAERQGSYVVLSVKDTGVGIPPEMLPKIFEMFTQVDQSLERSQGGLGIGLTLVQRLVEMHEGSVRAFSGGPGRGSEFVVRLPLLNEKREQAPPEPSVSKSTPISARRILIVDDNRDAAATLAMLFKLTGNKTQMAYDGLEAVEAAAEFRPDVVLLDIGLPKLNGYEAARRIREQPWGKSVALVALTGWGQDEDRRKSSEAGFDSHIVKPVDHAALTKVLAELLAR